MPRLQPAQAVRRRGRGAPPAPITDPEAAARAAGLRYVDDSGPGIRRKRSGRGFAYLAPDGTWVTDRAELERIRKLAIPPAWTDVWISPTPRGHIQATGRDEKGRKQYRYHDLWRCFRDATKFQRMVAFGETLPTIRRRVEADLEQSGLTQQRVLATVVRLLDETRIRVGNEEYARENHSYGLTTLRNEHVRVRGSRLRFQFRGKSGKEHEVEVSDRRVARLVKRLQELPGHNLFAYRDDAGELHSVESGDVNEYLREIAGQDFTAKDFRTWSGTVLAAGALAEVGPAESEAQGKRNVAQAIKAVARQLGNTPAVCRKSYVHPAVIESYLHQTLSGPRREPLAEQVPDGLDEGEYAVLLLLRRLEEQAKTPRKAG